MTADTYNNRIKFVLDSLGLSGGEGLDTEVAAAEMQCSFEELRGRLRVIDLAQGDSLNEVIAEWNAAVLAHGKNRADIIFSMFRAESETPAGPCAANIRSVGGNGIAVVYIDTAEQPATVVQLMSGVERGVLPAPDHFPVLPAALNKTEMWQRFTFEHEVAHTLLNDKLSNRFRNQVQRENAMECAADAFAMLRHYQRHGMDSAFPQYWKDMRVMGLVNRADTAHYTLAALDRVDELAREGKLAGLNDRELLDLSFGIAVETAHSWRVEKVAKAAFSDMAQYARMRDPDVIVAAIGHVAETGATTVCPAVHDIACRWLEACGRRLPENHGQEDALARGRRRLGEKQPQVFAAVGAAFRSVAWRARAAMMLSAPRPGA